MKKIFTLSFFFLLLIVIACTNDPTSTIVNPNNTPSNNPPNIPKNPYPENGAISMPNYIVFSWTCTDPDDDATLTYTIYLWSNNNIAAIDSAILVETTSVLYNNLTNGTIYSWKIKAIDNHGAVTIGPIWNFTTATK